MSLTSAALGSLIPDPQIVGGSGLGERAVRRVVDRRVCGFADADAEVPSEILLALAVLQALTTEQPAHHARLNSFRIGSFRVHGRAHGAARSDCCHRAAVALLYG